MKLYKYYLMGCQPGAGLFKTEDYGYKRGECMGGMVRALGVALYRRILSQEEVKAYELAYGGEVVRVKK